MSDLVPNEVEVGVVERCRELPLETIFLPFDRSTDYSVVTVTDEGQTYGIRIMRDDVTHQGRIIISPIQKVPESVCLYVEVREKWSANTVIFTLTNPTGCDHVFDLDMDPKDYPGLVGGGIEVRVWKW